MQNNFIYGIRTIIEAIDSGKTIDKILFKSDLKGQLSNELFNIAKNNKIPIQFVPLQKINQYTRANHQGVIAFISPIEYADIEELTQKKFEEGKAPFFLILDGVTDVRNFGAIARTAECAGVDAIIIPTKGSAKVTEDAIKTSAGALYKIPVARVNNLHKTVQFLKYSGLQIISASEKGSTNYYENDFIIPTALIMGSEDRGVSSEMLKISDNIVKIPIIGRIDSLNVSNASSIIIYEAVRQRLINSKK